MILTKEDKESRENEMHEMCDPIVVELPLRGEWLVPNTPGTKIPSHGTNKLGTRYAYDFIQADCQRCGSPAYRVSFLHYLFLGVPLKAYYCWGQAVYAPCDGIVVQAKDGYQERARTHLLTDTFMAFKNRIISIRKKIMNKSSQEIILSLNIKWGFMLRYVICKGVPSKFQLGKV